MFDIFTFILLIVFALGFGSFATMAIYRLPNNMPWISEKPFCPKCRHELYFRDYFSLISFFLSKGKCRFCHGEIEYHKAYFITELLILGYFIANYLVFNFTDTFIINSGIIIAITIWSVIFINSNKHFDHILKLCLFFICLKQVSLGLSITDLILEIALISFFIIANWHLYFFIKHDTKAALSYLKFTSGNRFEDEKYLIIKITILLLLSLKLSSLTIIISYITIAALFLLNNNTRLNLAILANLIIVANLINYA